MKRILMACLVCLGGAAIWASAVDGAPLAQSKRILVTHLTDVQNTGARFSDESMKILLKWGGLPHLMRRGRAEVSLAVDAGAFTVYVLDEETAAKYKEQNDAILEADTVVGR